MWLKRPGCARGGTRVVGVAGEPFVIRPMTEPDARAVAAWRYPGVYAFYDWERDPADLAELLDPAEWGRRYFAVDRAGRLAGLFVFTVLDDMAEIGLALAPELTGRGLGGSFLAAGMRFAVETFGVRRQALRVAAFNRRAIAVYERAGFAEIDRYLHATNGGVHEFVLMERGSPLAGAS
jgi:[ribosomal protein S18]-alanine N-acetyltransferase